MKGGRRAWLWAGAPIGGFALAMIVGAGIAAADNGDGTGTGTRGVHQSHSAPNHASTARPSARANAAKLPSRPASSSSRLGSSRLGIVQRVEQAATPPLRSGAVADSVVVTPTPVAVTTPSTNGITGVKTGDSDLVIPIGTHKYTASADWYLPTQADGSVNANGIIWLQHGFLADNSFYTKLATQLALQTNSIVVAPTLPSLPIACSGCWINGAPMEQAVAAMFLGDRKALHDSAVAAGYYGTLPEQYILAGHAAGGGFAVSVAGYTVDNGAADDAKLAGVVMFDGVLMGDRLGTALQSLDTLGVPVYQVAAPAQAWNAFGATTTDLLELRPDQFDGVVLAGGSHVDSMLGSIPIVDAIAQFITQTSPVGNTAAAYTLGAGWINDLYAASGPTDPQYGFYASAGEPIILGDATAFGLAATDSGYGTTTPTKSNGVTGVRVRNSDLTIPCESGYVASADWYLPTQADGSVQANGVIWLQHGLLGDKTLFVVLARELAQRTNSIVVAPTVTSVPVICTGCWIDGVGMDQAIAEMFVGDRTALNASANAAGYVGTLPQNYILAGHSIGGGLAAAAGGYSVQNGAADGNLRGVVMFDGVSLMVDGLSLVDTFPDALASLDSLGIPVYQLAAPPQTWNTRGLTTTDLTALHPGQFVGIEIEDGSHSDAILDSKSSSRYDLLVAHLSPPGATAAIYTLASGWINDMYVGAGPSDPRFGIYGDAGQQIIMGDAIGIPLPIPA